MFLDLDKKDENKIAAIDDRGNSITYGSLIENGDKVAKIVPPRSIVFLLCENTVPVLSAYISIILSDSIPLLLDLNLDKALLDSLIETYEPQYVAKPDSSKAMGISFKSTGYPPYPVNEKLEFLLTTSGSTGSPKLVRHKKGNLDSSARNVAKAFGWTENEKPACYLPMHYTMGLNVINTHLYVGATLAFISSSITSGAFWTFIRESGCTNFTGVPFSYEIMIKLRLLQKEWPDLKALSEGGGRLTDDIFKTLASYASDNNKKFFASFGTTETTSRISLLNPDLATVKTGSIGKAIPEVELFLLDPDTGNPLEENPCKGELACKGPNVTMGYGESKEDLLLDDEFKGFYRTGDLAYRDEEGFYYIEGRLGRFLKLLGHRIDLNECERLVAEKFSLPVACSGDDQAMLVHIESPGTDIDPLDISDYLGEKTGISSSKYQVILHDSLPRNEYGKIIYTALDKDK